MQKIIWLLFVLGSLMAYGKEESKEIKNFYKVSEELYRSAQPEKEDMKILEKKGVKTILNLREYNSDNSEAKGSKIVLKRVKMNAGNIKDKEIIEALKIIKNAEKPVLVHCWHGSDRTGVVIAMYRIIFENITKEKAIEEMKEKKYGHHSKIYGNIEKYIIKSDIEKLKKEIIK